MMRRTPFDAVVFDLDGTLLDTESITHAAGIAAFAAQGIAVDPGFLHALVGVDDATSASRIATAFPAMEMAAFARVWLAEVHGRQAAGIALKPGAADLLHAIAQPKALATSSQRASADRKLALTGLAVHFAHVITVDDVARPKPAPDPFLRAAALLGADPARCLAFEDSDTGAASARAAGFTVVQVPDMLLTDGRHAHVVAPDLMAGARAVGLI
ncbi:MAG TPA: HAD family phosphatase [Paracoccaceae bacterium]|nr:HAD family phosphatase [Paracoccaceae bacterium]HMO70467.1 HAD family phosphatase [Paracoccaceae bacterium]